MIGFTLSLEVIVPALLSALLAIFIRSLYELVKNLFIARNIKKLLEVEIKKNNKFLNHIEGILDFLDDPKEGTLNIGIMNLTEEMFKAQYVDNEDYIKEIKTLINSADRQINLLSTLIYKDIFLKSALNFHSKEDRSIHRIYVLITEIEKYKAFISTFDKEKNELEMYQAYFKIFDNVTNALDEIKNWESISKKTYKKLIDRVLLID
ncbi:hypothetical protein [Exiguobacterium acetylicum]|uniref:hypothetical protein n=1 Tax=Exiguobacterium acetylicum TaxID=41170 RepID=UPI003019DC77